MSGINDKNRLVVIGFQQKTGIDYIEIFSLVLNLTTIRLVAAKNVHLKQLDIKNTFFYGDLEEEIYMK